MHFSYISIGFSLSQYYTYVCKVNQRTQRAHAPYVSSEIGRVRKNKVRCLVKDVLFTNKPHTWCACPLSCLSLRLRRLSSALYHILFFRVLFFVKDFKHLVNYKIHALHFATTVCSFGSGIISKWGLLSSVIADVVVLDSRVQQHSPTMLCRPMHQSYLLL